MPSFNVHPLQSAQSLLQRAPAGTSAAAATVLGLAGVIGLNRTLNNYVLGNPLLGGANTCTWGKSCWAHAIVLITGGSSGIGRLMVARFAELGIQVVVLDRQAPAADNVFPTGVVFFQVDLMDAAAVEAVAARVKAEVGDPTVVVNNAGLAYGKTLLEATSAEIQRLFAVNAVAPLLVTRAFLPAMVRANHGHVVNMASAASFVTVASNVDYSCTKASVLAFHEGLLQELRHRYHAPAVRATIVHPYWVRTPLLQDIAKHKHFNEPLLEPAQVVDIIVPHVLCGRSGSIIVPGRLDIASRLRAFPIWLQELIRNSKAGTLEVVAEVRAEAATACEKAV